VNLPVGYASKRRVFAVAAVILLLAGIWPIKYLASPNWDVWVTQKDGAPVQSIKVRLSYQNYSTENKDHEITLIADQRGHVQFVPQYQRACFFQRAFYTLLAARAFVHASFGPNAFVFAFGEGYEGSTAAGDSVTYWSGSPEAVESKIVVTQAKPKAL
jgi:hypothetical protein